MKAREALGDEVVLGVDYHHRLSVAEAASYCQKMPSGTLDFLEEPIRHDFINYTARTIRPDMVSQWPPTELAEGYYWEVVRENYTLEDQGRVMHMYYANPLQHAEGMLYAYLPKEKILIENDIVNTNNPMPAMPTRDMTTLRNNVRALGLDVQTLVPIHGKPIPWSDFTKLFPAQPRQTASAN